MPRVKFLERAASQQLDPWRALQNVMFGWRSGQSERSQPSGQGARAFGILHETIREGQQRGEVRSEDTLMLARLVWAQVHGISTLRLEPDLSAEGAGTRFVQFCSEILQTGLVTR